MVAQDPNYGRTGSKLLFPGIQTFRYTSQNPGSKNYSSKCSPYCSALTFFFIQLFFNLIWTTLFFKWNMYKTALLDIVVMFGFSVITFLKYFEINPIAAYLLLPYLAWLCLAFTLNAYIVAYN